MTPIEKFERFYLQLQSKDISNIGDVYADDIELVDPIATHHGLDTVTQYFGKLLKGTRECEFKILSILPTSAQDANHSTYDYVVEWKMSFSAKKLKANKVIQVDGVTLLKTSDTHVIYHRDYYDMGQLVYEHVPLLGHIVRRLKEQLQ
ncbi:nuclear transport factor 2 family protein [Alteromonas oceanisediminis]|uniref:nuclear transport factor 2 family protein n=1 Tax=Alteromonas oceanisediminis TaxID=2836180 RepID=UPI001BDA3EFF|nr:nuclear transport factor 2 family protein [Alteromonas oceanisediminis]MBT0585832.1 nuclear transport factor 2 family protein [Alteromonas oceanisediminis]